jgi:hypothetical protein
MRKKMRMNTLLSPHPFISSSLHLLISSSPHPFITSSPHYPYPPQNGDQQAIPFKPKTENEIEPADAPRAVVSFGRCPRIRAYCVIFLRLSKNQREIPSFSRFILGFK